jgi:hypothetical protein
MHPHTYSAEQQLALPLDLVVRFGICQLHLDKLPSALQCFASLRQRVRGSRPNMQYAPSIHPPIH